MAANVHYLHTNPRYQEAQRLGARNGDPLEVARRGTPKGHLRAFIIGALLGWLAAVLL